MMFHVIAVLYPTEQRAERVMAQLQHVHASDMAYLENMVFLTKDAAGTVRVQRQPGTFASNAGEMMIDALIVMLTTGLPSEVSAHCFDESFVNRLRATMGCASSAMIICMRQMVGDRVLPALSALGGFALQTTVHGPTVEASPQWATETALLA